MQIDVTGLPLIVERVCRYCEANFIIPRSQLKHRRADYCGYHCRGMGERTVLADRFWPKVNQTPTCWLWTARLNKGGYGTFGPGGREHNRLATHIAWKLATGTYPPSGMLVCHSCDVRACIRNDEPGIYIIRGIARPRFGHLWLGTHADNAADMIEKGRQPSPTERSTVMLEHAPKGERNGRSKLNRSTIAEIAAKHAAGVSQVALAGEYHLAQSTISRLVNGKRWGHLMILH
jgi:hypothetical protein